MSEIDAIVEQVGGSPLALAKVARTLLLPKGQGDRARALCDQALAMAPDDGEVRAIHAEVFSAHVGAWYFNMVLDDARHAAIEGALTRALRSGGRVLEIGAGVGLFAMMAAKAGADEVITCERQWEVAQAASAVIARNGLQERVKVVPKASTDLVVGIDMDGPADVLLCDNIGSNLIGVGVLPALEDAMRRLVKPGGAVIPARCAIKAALAEHVGLGDQRMARARGFDLSPFNVLAKPTYMIDPDSRNLALRSGPTTLFDFDFTTGGPFPAERVRREAVGGGGQANGVVQWLEFAMDDQGSYQTGPGATSCAFALAFHPTRESFQATAGAPFTIGASHDRGDLRVWLEGE